MIVTTVNDQPGSSVDEVLREVAGLGSTWTEICAYGIAVRVSRL